MRACGLAKKRAAWLPDFALFAQFPKRKNVRPGFLAEVSKKWKVNGNKALKKFFGSPVRSSEKFALCLILYFVCMRRFFLLTKRHF